MRQRHANSLPIAKYRAGHVEGRPGEPHDRGLVFLRAFRLGLLEGDQAFQLAELHLAGGERLLSHVEGLNLALQRDPVVAQVGLLPFEDGARAVELVPSRLERRLACGAPPRRTARRCWIP